MRRPIRRIAWCALLAAGAARADIVLDGAQHVGDSRNAIYTPSDAVRRAQMSAWPSHFNLSRTATITAVEFTGIVQAVPHVEAVTFDGVARGGTLSGDTFTLASPVTLSAGIHTVWPDPGCQSGAVSAPCPAVQENELSFSAMRLVSAQDTSTVMIDRRRHIGDDDDIVNGYGLPWYPDATEGSALDLPFTLDRNRTLGVIHVYRLRDVYPLPSIDEPANVRIDGDLVGQLTADGNPFILQPNKFLTAGSHVLRIESGSIGPTNLDSISWDDVLLFLGDAPGGVAGGFDAVDSGDAALTGHIGTKVAGAPFDLAIYALDAAATAVLGSYEGNVLLELVNGATGADCASLPAVASLGTATIAAGGGGAAVVPVSYDGALRIGRIRVTDLDLGVSGCSRDAFAIRPAGFHVEASDTDASTAGTARSLASIGLAASPVHRAGQPFTIRVAPVDVNGNIVTGYDMPSMPTLGLTLQAPVLGAPDIASLQTGTWAVMSDGTVRTDTAVFNDVGGFTLKASDPDFADTDTETSESFRAIPPGTAAVGRFVPDHFALSAKNVPELAAGCATFSYVGQPLTYFTVPVVTIAAVTAAGVVTPGYAQTDGLFRLPSSFSPAQTYTVDDGAGTIAASLAPPDASVIASTGAGLATLTLPADPLIALVRGTPAAPFDLKLEFGAGLAGLTDADGVQWADAANTPVVFDGAVAGEGMAFVANHRQQRFGRLVAQNAHGPETQDLVVPYQAEYAATGGGFVTNTIDGCTAAPAATLTGGTLTPTVGLPTPIAAGLGSVTLGAQLEGSTGTAQLTFALPDWLKVDQDGDGAYDDDAQALATFGAYEGGEERIFIRETYR